MNHLKKVKIQKTTDRSMKFFRKGAKLKQLIHFSRKFQGQFFSKLKKSQKTQLFGKINSLNCNCRKICETKSLLINIHFFTMRIFQNRFLLGALFVYGTDVFLTYAGIQSPFDLGKVLLTRFSFFSTHIMFICCCC